ncbi:MAG: response regulator transcription factor [Chloroflexi bacterium]|nr:response regulator transcription factor [Chloroflexota bacterium]
MPQAVTIVIIGDDALARAGLAALLERGEGVSISAQLTEGEATPEALAAFSAQVLLWDVGWGPLLPARLEAVRALALPLVADAAQAAEVRLSGARGLLKRTARPSQVQAAIHAVAEGIAVYDASLAERGWAPQAGLNAADELTSREIEVLRLLAEGLSNKAIAGRLNVTEHTVKFHVNAILGKLGAQSRTEAVTRATRLGLIIL